MQEIKTDVIIIGAGPVGLFSVFQCGMLNMKCHVIDSLPEIGGQCSALYPEKPIYDIPSRPMVTGDDLISSLSDQVAPFNPTYHLNQQVVGVQKQRNDWFVETCKGTKIISKVVIIAAGAGAFGPNRPPIENIKEFENSSVFYMVRDRSKFADKNIVIAGGGDSAVDWAVSLFDVANKITVIHRRDKFRAMPETVEKMHDMTKKYPEKMQILTPYQLSQLHGDDGVLNKISLKSMDGDVVDINADVLLAFYGLVPSLGPIKDWGLDLSGQTIMVDPLTCETSCPSIYAVGDIASYDKKLKLILTGFSEVASAAHDAYKYVYPDQALHFEYSTSKGVK